MYSTHTVLSKILIPQLKTIQNISSKILLPNPNPSQMQKAGIQEDVRI